MIGELDVAAIAAGSAFSRKIRVTAVTVPALHHGTVRQPREAGIAVPKPNFKPSKSASAMSAQRLSRLLIVEDDELSRDILTRWLKRHGYGNVDAAVDGDEGLEACLRDPPDILILDHAMPGLSGLALAEYLCINFKREERPWILLFTAASDVAISRLMSTGYFDDLLRKPCISDDYQAALDRAHAGLRQRRRAGTSGPYAAGEYMRHALGM